MTGYVFHFVIICLFIHLFFSWDIFFQASVLENYDSISANLDHNDVMTLSALLSIS